MESSGFEMEFTRCLRLQTCSCNGTVFFGVNETSTGDPSTFSDVVASPYSAGHVAGSATCDAAIGGGSDPLPGAGKACWCLPHTEVDHTRLCSVEEGPVRCLQKV